MKKALNSTKPLKLKLNKQTIMILNDLSINSIEGGTSTDDPILGTLTTYDTLRCQTQTTGNGATTEIKTKKKC